MVFARGLLSFAYSGENFRRKFTLNIFHIQLVISKFLYCKNLTVIRHIKITANMLHFSVVNATFFECANHLVRGIGNS